MRSKLNIAAMLAATAAAVGGATGFGAAQPATARRERKPIATMAVSPPEEIAAWNRAVDERKATRRRAGGKFRIKLHVSGQNPKFPKTRAHKQHKHPLRDEHGAYTLVGSVYEVEGLHPTQREHVVSGWVDGEQFGYTLQRKWLGGTSAQRGY